MTAYLTPSSIDEALHLLAAHAGDALVLAGGTDVLPDIRRGKRNPVCLIDVTRIPELGEIQVQDGFVYVGAAVTFAVLKDDPFLARHVPALTDAARSVGAIGIQTAATWVGNLVQAMPAADGAIVALALDAEVRVLDAPAPVRSNDFSRSEAPPQSPPLRRLAGGKWRPVASLFLGPGRSAIDPSRQLITHVRFPLPAAPWGTAWQRVGRRPSLVLPILNCAAKLVLAGNRIQEAAVALGPVAPRPFRANGAEAFLIGKPAEDALLEQAAHVAQGEAQPRSSPMRASRAYRLSIVPVLVAGALKLAAARASEPIEPAPEL